jgi:hypothetical protein
VDSMMEDTPANYNA